MPNTAEIIGGLFLIIAAGVCNGSWNASFSPKQNLCVSKSEPHTHKTVDANTATLSPFNDLTYHHAFALFQIYAAIINIPICILWAGGIARVGAILRESTPASIVLIIVFSVLWGFGTLLFGLACKVAGVGMGTNLSIGVVAVLGTLLPLIVEDKLLTPVGAVICSGLTICCMGLWLSTRALVSKDEDQRKAENIKKEVESECSVVSKGEKSDAECDANLSYQRSSSFPECEKRREDGEKSEDDESIYVDEPWPQTESVKSLESDGDISTTNVAKIQELSTSPPLQNEVQYPIWKKVGICVATGVFAVQLQFAFIFGKKITDLALGNIASSSPLPGSTHESGGAAIIWLFAITFGAPASIVNGIISSPVPLSSAIRTPLSRHIKVICCASLPWLFHIHVYGVCATTLLPDRIAASIGWPMLMMVTTFQALVLSIYLGEWKVASDQTKRILKWSLAVMSLGLVVLMCSAAMPIIKTKITRIQRKESDRLEE